MDRRTYNALLKREVRTSVAEEIASSGTSLSHLKQMTDDELKNKGLSSNEIQSILSGNRPSIPDEILNEVLFAAKRTCSYCQNDKNGVIIHHIEEWNVSRNHGIENLIVLCPNCHDSAHTNRYLTRILDKKQLIHAKKSWERQVARFRIQVAKGQKAGIDIGYGYDKESGKLEIWDHRENFFSRRMGLAFPGKIGFTLIEDPTIAVERLEILLGTSIVFDVAKSHGASSVPLKWYRGTNQLSIEKFKKVDDNHIQINYELLNVKRIVAYSSARHPNRQFIYCEFNADEPIPEGSSYDLDKLKEIKRDYFLMQNYGIYYGNYTSLESYHDGAFEVNGKVIMMDGSEEGQYRYLTPYNFIISYDDSDFNREEVKKFCQEALDSILRGEYKFEDLEKNFMQIVGDY